MIILISLIFISKIALSFIPGFPYQESFVIFQHGLHPFINIFLNIIIGVFLVYQFMSKNRHHYLQSKIYKFYLLIFFLYIIFVTSAQSFLNESSNSFLLQMGAALSACFTVFLFSRVIPSELPALKFLKIVKNISVGLCYISLFMLVVFSGLSFKGGRFIGVFKHIPYMVTVATIACQFLIYDLFIVEKDKLKTAIAIFSLLIAFLLLVLTGTRSALFAVLLSYFLAFLFFPAKKPTTQFLKVSVAFAALIGSLLFGNTLMNYTIDIVRGDSSVGLRAAQDGVASRFDEFQRGYDIFQKNPILGQGLLSKFGEINETDVGQYNANKDPHNILVSAGVIGGLGFVIIILVGAVGLILACLKKLKSRAPEFKILAIYLLTHIPILFIYHVHLSLGGMADRLYWIVIGYMMISSSSLKKADPKY